MYGQNSVLLPFSQLHSCIVLPLNNICLVHQTMTVPLGRIEYQLLVLVNCLEINVKMSWFFVIEIPQKLDTEKHMRHVMRKPAGNWAAELPYRLIIRI